MQYLVIEIQKINDQLAYLVTTHDTREEAESKFYTVLAAAAISGLPLHAATLLNEAGNVLRSDHYTHEQPTSNELDEIE